MSFRNSEGYNDPTAGEAIRRATAYGFRPVVYICSPFSGDVEKNMEDARKYCRYAVDLGYIPIAPHLLFPQFMKEATERDLAIFMDLVLLGKCAQVWVFGDSITEGMSIEIKRARFRQMKIRRFTKELGEKEEK